MLSLLTNLSAQSALRMLSSTQKSLATTQTQVTTGLRVSSAKDNAAYWSIATSMSSRVGEMKAVEDGLDLTSAIISTTNAALASILGMVQKMSSLVVTAQTAGVDIASVQSQITELQQGIVSTANAATFNGVNWLVTHVVGTNTTSNTAVIDATYTTDQGIRAHGADGVDHDAATYTVSEDVTRTLASTSSSHNDTASYALFTLTGSTIAGVHTVAVVPSNQSITSHASGDLTGYQIGQIPMSIATDGSVVFSVQNFHQTELFQSFSGTFAGDGKETFTDQTINHTYPNVPAANLDPYFTIAQNDLLDAPFFGVIGEPNILNMVLTSAGDASFAAPIIDTAIKGITNGLTFLGGLQNEVDGSEHVNEILIDALTSGIGSLIDADMNQASTRLSALQTQQQLGVQALSVANDNSQIILKLFGS